MATGAQAEESGKCPRIVKLLAVDPQPRSHNTYRHVQPRQQTREHQDGFCTLGVGKCRKRQHDPGTHIGGAGAEGSGQWREGTASEHIVGDAVGAPPANSGDPGNNYQIKPKNQDGGWHLL